MLKVTVPKFEPEAYTEEYPEVTAAIRAGMVESAYDHFLRFGIDQQKGPVRRDALSLAGAVERFVVSASGYCLLLGWLADEGSDRPALRLLGGDFSVDLPPDGTFRHARPDVEAQIRAGAYDYGFVSLGQSPSKALLKQNLLFQAVSGAGSLKSKISPEVVSDRRLLDIVLEFSSSFQAHSGREPVLNSFLGGSGGNSLVELFQDHVAQASRSPYVETFGRRSVSTTFITVLFGSTEAMKIQPLLFRGAGIDFGEWIYVCNSPEDAQDCLRLGRLMSTLYGLMITVVVMGDNVGFGAANNAAIGVASSSSIFLINPDVYPIVKFAPLLQEMLRAQPTAALRGGLLFYDEGNLMHSGMYLAADAYVRQNALNVPGERAGEDCVLARVEHFDKGVPFHDAEWQEPREVEAITGAVMAFGREQFERLGGFSTRYIYGHYEDADLSIRWRERFGSVFIDPNMRLVHLEGQGSRARGNQYKGAAMVNRFLFSHAHSSLLHARREAAAASDMLSSGGV